MAIADILTSPGQKVPNYILQSFMASKGAYKASIDGDFQTESMKAARKLLVSKFSVTQQDADAWGRARLALAIEQAFLQDRKFYPGKVDGLIGPLQKDAQERWQSSLRSTAAVANPPRVAKPTNPQGNIPVVAMNWPTQAQVRNFYGAPGEHLVSLTLPFPMRLAWDTSEVVNHIQCHAKVHDSLKRILTRILTHYGLPTIKRLGIDLFGGCFNIRKMKGGNAMSMHSWGIAIDLDPDHNQLRWGADRARMDNPDYAFVVQAFEDEGWVSLGRARNYDWMHFQAARF